MATTKLFNKRQCQGGGVTWAAILFDIAARHGKIGGVLAHAPEGAVGEARAIQTRTGSTWFSVDDEGDAALFCSDDSELVKSVEREQKELNDSPDLLTERMQVIPTTALECER